MGKLLIIAMLLLAAAAVAQSPAPAQDSLEPGVNTSAPAAKPAAPPESAAAPGGPAAKPSTAKPAAASAPNKPGQKGSAKDRLDLESTQITGNRELPKVLYIVPWKKPDPAELHGDATPNLMDEVLAPVDREVFTRQLQYYDALHSQP
jgi:hypothetical protein